MPAEKPVRSGLESKEKEKARYFELVDQLTRAKDASEQAQLKEELARLTFRDSAPDPVGRR